MWLLTLKKIENMYKLRKIFLNMTPIPQVLISTISEHDLVKLKSLYTGKDNNA